MTGFWRIVRYAAYRGWMLGLATVTIAEGGTMFDSRGKFIGAVPRGLRAPLPGDR